MIDWHPNASLNFEHKTKIQVQHTRKCMTLKSNERIDFYNLEESKASIVLDTVSKSIWKFKWYRKWCVNLNSGTSNCASPQKWKWRVNWVMMRHLNAKYHFIKCEKKERTGHFTGHNNWVGNQIVEVKKKNKPWQRVKMFIGRQSRNNLQWKSTHIHQNDYS